MRLINTGEKTFKNVNSFVQWVSGARPISFNPALAWISKSPEAGLLLSQLLYWTGKGRKKGCVYKTIKEIKNETCLTRSKQERAIKIWEELGVLEVIPKGIPPTRHFYVNLYRLFQLLGCSEKDARYWTELAKEFTESDS